MEEKRLKKVVFVNLRLTGGGSERVMSMLASYFADHGIETQMILLEEKERTYPVSDIVEIIDCYCPMEGNKIIWHIKRILSLRKAIIKSGADTVVSFMWDINMKVILACMGLNKRIIISERADPNNVTRKRSMAFAQRWIFPLADAAVFQTEQVMNSYPEKVRRKGVIIPNPIPMITIDRNVEKEKTIIAAGRLYKQKNFEMMIEAFAIFSKKYDEYKLKIFGDGDLRENLEQKARELGVAEKVSFQGFVSNLKEEMNKACIYASSSNYEGISNAMLEAMAIGLPAVCTDCPVGGAAMVIKDHVNGILVPVNDHEKMAKAFSEIAEDDKLAMRLSENAIETCKQYSIDKIAKLWMEL